MSYPTGRAAAALALGGLLATVGMTTPTVAALAQTPAQIDAAVKAAYAKYKSTDSGKVADYIPELAKVNPNLFGIAVMTADGKVYTAGDVDSLFSIQSISKVFTMAEVMQEQGADAVREKLGVDASRYGLG